MTAAEENVPLSNGWSLWRTVCLRSAGFSVETVLDLAVRELSLHAGELDAARAREDAARERALKACRDASAHVAKERRTALRSLRKKLEKGQVPEGELDDRELAAASVELRAAKVSAGAASAKLDAHLRAERLRISGRLRELARDDEFREALTWQNRRLLSTAVAPLSKKPIEASDASTRQHEAVLAGYLQRFTTKNETIGFFGPVGWGLLGERAELVSCEPGPGLLAHRAVYFEHWAIDAFAAKLSENPRIRLHLAPRLAPRLRLDGVELSLPNGTHTILPDRYARALAACDGSRPAIRIARELGDEKRTLEVLEELRARNLILWSLEVPPHAMPYEEIVRAALEDIGDAEALGALEELIGKKHAVAAAAGRPDALAPSLDTLDETFQRRTGAAAIRRAGEAYAGRTIVYEDCRRDVRLELGAKLIDLIDRPLALVLASARWYSYVLAERYRAICREAHATLGGGTLEWLRFWERVSHHFSAVEGGPPPIVEETRSELARRWASILDVDSTKPAIDRASQAIASEVARAFAAPHPGWPGARHHSPDLLLSRGGHYAVLGELHVGVRAMCAPFFLELHPSPRALIELEERELDLPRAHMVPKREVYNRAAITSRSERDVDVELGTSKSWRPRSRVVAVGELELVAEDGALIVRTRDRRVALELMAFLEDILTIHGFAHFEIVRTERHSPRVSIDRLVVARERWRLRSEEVDFRGVLEAERWARKLGLPRFVFVKTPEEMKPFYVDFHSPLSVEIFAKAARRARSILISEMLPAHEEAWLTDANGRRYTAELRLTAVDPIRYPSGLRTPTPAR